MRSRSDKAELEKYILEGHSLEEAANHFGISITLAGKVYERAKNERIKVMNVVNFIADGHSLEEASVEFDISTRTINRMLDEVRKEDGLYYNEILAQKITLVLQKFLLEARSKAGKMSHRDFVLSDEDALKILDMILYEGKTLRSIAGLYGCSHTSVANAIKRIGKAELVRVRRETEMGREYTITEQDHIKRTLELLETVKAELDPEMYEEIRKIYNKPRGR